MTPQEKAKELIDKFIIKKTCVASVGSGKIQELCDSMSIDDAKECALICIDEILETEEIYKDEFCKFMNTERNKNFEPVFWQEVKQEINKI